MTVPDSELWVYTPRSVSSAPATWQNDSVRAAECSLAIIGAGVVGCALAQVLGRRGRAARSGGTGASILLLDAEAGPGRGISSRNSQVVHAGLYYPPGSRKARCCVEGNRALWTWAADHGIGHRQTGKLVVATRAPDQPELHDAQADALRELLDNARACGAQLEAVTLARARTLEPALPGTVTTACWSPTSGIIDVHALCVSLCAAAERNARVTPVYAARVTHIEAVRAGFVLETSRGPVLAERIVNAAGLHATTLARFLGVHRRLYPARGDYFRLRSHPPWRRLLYPVKTPGSPSLGVHLTLGLDGGARLGPDLDWRPSGAREDYDPARGEAKKAAFSRAGRRLLGPLDPGDLLYDGCGVRPKLVGAGEAMADFEVLESPPGAWHLLGIESPGLTASLALARELADLISN